MIYEVIEKYDLFLVSKHCYEYYGCESGKGLGEYNKNKFLRLREDFNKLKVDDYYHYISEINSEQWNAQTQAKFQMLLVKNFSI